MAKLMPYAIAEIIDEGADLPADMPVVSNLMPCLLMPQAFAPLPAEAETPQAPTRKRGRGRAIPPPPQPATPADPAPAAAPTPPTAAAPQTHRDIETVHPRTLPLMGSFGSYISCSHGIVTPPLRGADEELIREQQQANAAGFRARCQATLEDLKARKQARPEHCAARPQRPVLCRLQPLARRTNL